VFEVSKGQYVQFTEPELDSLEAEANSAIDLKEFIPLAKVDPIFYESTVYLGAGKGGEKAYRLLTDVMNQSGRAALDQTVTRGKEELVRFRPYGNALILHTMLYSDEVRDFAEVPKGENAQLSDDEQKLALALIEQLTGDGFDAEAYRDEYRERVLNFLDEKSKSATVKSAAPSAVQRGPGHRHHGGAQAKHGSGSSANQPSVSGESTEGHRLVIQQQEHERSERPTRRKGTRLKAGGFIVSLASHPKVRFPEHLRSLLIPVCCFSWY